MLLLLDNYDSFVYNLYQQIGEYEKDIQVLRNDVATLEEIIAMQPERIILSPGPGKPDDAGIMEDVISHFYDKIPILGVCLGHQAIGEVFGAKVVHAKEIIHGKSKPITIVNSERLFAGITDMDVARYHSLVIQEDTLPLSLEVTARSVDGEVMAIQHSIYPVYGVQFHPESILTVDGKRIIENFMGEKAYD